MRPLGAQPLCLSAQTLGLVTTGPAGLCRDVHHPSEIPVPTAPAVMAEKVGADAIRDHLEDIVPALGTGQLAP